MFVTAVGLREFHLKPGQYETKATKAGKPIRKELVTVIKDGRQVVRLTWEPPTE